MLIILDNSTIWYLTSLHSKECITCATNVPMTCNREVLPDDYNTMWVQYLDISHWGKSLNQFELHKKTCTRIQVAYPKVWFPFPYFITWESPSSTFKVHSYLLSLGWNGDMHTHVHTCQVTCVKMQGQPARVTYPCGSQGVNSDCQAHWQVSLPVDLSRGPSFLNFLLKYFNDLIVRLGRLFSEHTNKWNS